MRTEEDLIGKKEIADHHLYGIHSLRAKENFDNTSPFPIEWYKAIGQVKLAYYNTYQKFRATAQEKGLAPPKGHHWMSQTVLDALAASAEEVSQGQHFDHFIVPAIQGGAGTSINMNVNEIIANRSLLRIGHQTGEYHHIDPLDHANIYQSTNDVIPTALHIALIRQAEVLSEAINTARGFMETLEKRYGTEMRQAYTQMQQAVPSTYGHLFGSYNNALSRDWWRITRIRERLKEINIGGGAAGTGMGIPRFFIHQVPVALREITGLPLSVAENRSDATMNNDDLVEAHAILKALAVNLEKIAGDLRLLGSDLYIHQSVNLPQRQMGSSIMPGKVNPVIPEFIISISHKVYANDQLIASLSAQGCLDLNAYLPAIGAAFMESFQLLHSGCIRLGDKMLQGLTVDSGPEKEEIFKNPSITTVLVPYIGHQKAALLAQHMKESNGSVFESNNKLKIILPEDLRQILSPSSLTTLGFSLKNID
ncbi:lyase family protein [Thermophagus sp. OGC60D27]|uniref:lyase family protein n=1 Tax=Thermophagus sp. OGC60D27 TaxID=3458415 RepID=UPI004037C05D